MFEKKANWLSKLFIGDNSKLFEKKANWLSKLFIGEIVTCKLAVGPGSKTKEFTECKSRSKRRKISSKHPVKALALATKHRAKSSTCQKDLGFVVDKTKKSYRN